MKNHLKKAINIAKKTGDRLIIFDSLNSDEAYAVMSLDEYEKLVIGKSEVRGLTEDELLDKINRDIAIWKSDKDEEEMNEKKVDNYPDFRDNYLFKEGQESKDFVKVGGDEKKKSGWGIPKDIKEAAEEVIDEDRQYLEEITF